MKQYRKVTKIRSGKWKLVKRKINVIKKFLWENFLGSLIQL